MPDRLQREIDEILSKLEAFPPKQPLSVRARRRLAQVLSSAGRWLASLPLPRISLGQLMLISIAIILVGYIVGFGSGSITRFVIAAGLVGFIAAFILSLRRTSRPPEKRWRGQPMELQGPGVGDRLRSWWERWRSRK